MIAEKTATETVLETDAQHNSGLWNPSIVFTHGEGVTIYDADGNAYIDCMAGIAVASMGHNNPRLVKALSEQAARLIIVSQAHANDVRSEFYEKLFTFIPEWMNLSRVFMANSGSEANEAALKWAKAATGRSGFVSAKRGFSGRTLGVLALTWEKKYRAPFEPLPYDNSFIRYGDIQALDAAITEETAAVFLEPVQGEGGMHPSTKPFLEAARKLCDERGALLIMDEVQSGVGRTGKFLATEHYEVRPDMVTLAKGLGGGVPIGALLLSEEVALKMPKGGHGTTFGGNALASAAALAVLEEIEERELLDNVREVGNYFINLLADLEHPKIREVRGLGLMIGVEFKQKVAPIIAALQERGVLTINAGATVIRFVPPLIFSKADADKVVEILADVLESF